MALGSLEALFETMPCLALLLDVKKQLSFVPVITYITSDCKHSNEVSTQTSSIEELKIKVVYLIV